MIKDEDVINAMDDHTPKLVRYTKEDIPTLGSFPLFLVRGGVSRRSTVCGIGTNDAPYRTYLHHGKLICPAYGVWRRILERQVVRDRMTIDPAWLSFMTFREWFVKQPWRDSSIDFSLTQNGEYEIAPANAVFIPLHYATRIRQVARWILDPDARIKPCGLPSGVNKCPRTGAFRASFKAYGATRTKYLGQYATVEDAKERYDYALAGELELIQEMVADTNPRLAGIIEEYALNF